MANITLLIVDDDEYLRELMCGAFDDCTVITAINGEDGDLKHAEQGPFDVVITDLQMPICTGPEMIKRIRQRMPDQAFMLLSGNPNLLAAAERELKVPVMGKPFASLITFIETVKQLAQGRNPVRS